MTFFFFQAEDGIRDADVTGVQTCALPISFRFSTFRLDIRENAARTNAALAALAGARHGAGPAWRARLLAEPLPALPPGPLVADPCPAGSATLRMVPPIHREQRPPGPLTAFGLS